MNNLINTASASDLARRSRAKMYEFFDTPECEPFLPPKAAIGETRLFTRNQALLLMIHSDLNRWGLSVPFAGKVACRIGEALAGQPDAQRAIISFHENGAAFFVATDAEPADLPREGSGVGQVRFRIVFELSAYRDAISAAFGEVRDEAA